MEKLHCLKHLITGFYSVHVCQGALTKNLPRSTWSIKSLLSFVFYLRIRSSPDSALAKARWQRSRNFASSNVPHCRQKQLILVLSIFFLPNFFSHPTYLPSFMSFVSVIRQKIVFLECQNLDFNLVLEKDKLCSFRENAWILVYINHEWNRQQDILCLLRQWFYVWSDYMNSD